MLKISWICFAVEYWIFCYVWYQAECPSWYCYILILIYRVYIWWLFPSWSSYIPAMQGHSSHSPGCIMTNRICVFIYSYSYMKTYRLFVMIHPGECEESPCIAGIYELQLGNSHHIWVFIYAYSYINVKLGHSATIYIWNRFFTYLGTQWHFQN